MGPTCSRLGGRNFGFCRGLDGEKLSWMKNIKVVNWYRQGLFYIAEVGWTGTNEEMGKSIIRDSAVFGVGFGHVEEIGDEIHILKYTITRKLDFISYHLIRLIHGEEKLNQMASKIPKEY